MGFDSVLCPQSFLMFSGSISWAICSVLFPHLVSFIDAHRFHKYKPEYLEEKNSVGKSLYEKIKKSLLKEIVNQKKNRRG